MTQRFIPGRRNIQLNHCSKPHISQEFSNLTLRIYRKFHLKKFMVKNKSAITCARLEEQSHFTSRFEFFTV